MNRQSMGWEFETVRAPRNNSDDSTTSADSMALTEKPTSTATAPRSLRMLFEQQHPSSSPEPFRIPLPRSQLTTPTPQYLPPSGKSTPVPRQDSNDADQSDAYDSSADYDLQTARQPRFPPARNEFRAVPQRAGAAVDDSADESQATDSTSNLRPPQSMRSVRSYKEIRTTKGVGDIAIPPKLSPGLAVPRSGATDTESSSPDGSPPPPSRSGTSPVPPLQPQRRQGASPANFQFPPPSTRAVEPPPNFQFPPPGARSGAPSPTPDSLSVTTALRAPNFDQRRPSPQRGQTLPSLPEMSPAVEKKSADLLDVGGFRGSPSPSLGGSATPTPSTMPLRPAGPSRQPSASVLDSAPPPVKPFARQARSGSATSQSSLENPPAAGLRAPSRTARNGSASTTTIPPDSGLTHHGPGAGGSSVGLGSSMSSFGLSAMRDPSKVCPYTSVYIMPS
ncbi:hypothetical protein EXIGLDRAFT_218305 [Exidia glandulosa HHB12029]|uniref:Uncharacterized protein n=1 Tax=Exidia glandulosa HHB12029 TaxID=1314781 RepID=A0A165EDU7_EXIGL|nr:hypothetical protein EXIGLDRAFT_218305 [Exidia glandulosa HHB12029]